MKQKLELDKVLKVEIREIRVMAPLFFDFFVFLSNLRFKSQSLWLVVSKISQILFFFPFILRYINVKIGITITNLFLANPSTNERWL